MRTVESARALAAFHEYCQMGPERTLAKLAEKLGRSVSTLELWSSRHNWVERAKQYDQDRFKAVTDKTTDIDAQVYQTITTELLKSSQEMARAMEEEIENLRSQGRLGGQAVATIWKTATELKLSLAKQIEERSQVSQHNQDLATVLRAATEEELEVIERVISRLESQEQ